MVIYDKKRERIELGLNLLKRSRSDSGDAVVTVEIWRDDNSLTTLVIRLILSYKIDSLT